MTRGLRCRLAVLCLSLGLLTFMTGCHSAGVQTTTTTTTPPAVTIILGTAPASLGVGQTYQFSATVANATNTGVTWAVNGVTGGNSTVGTITGGTATTVTFNAPAAIPATNPVTVTATSQADGTKSASLTVMITQAGGGNSTPINVPGNQSKTQGINFSLTSLTPTLYITQIGTCTGTPASPGSCSFSVAPVTASTAAGTTTVILLGQDFTNGGSPTATLNPNLKVKVSTGTTTDVSVSNVTAEGNVSGFNVIIFTVTVSAGANQGPRAIIVKDSGTGEQQTYLGGIIIGP